MFSVHLASYEELTQDCQDQFGLEIGFPRPTDLNNMWHFVPFPALMKTGVTCIVFVNGMQDMWMGGLYIENLLNTFLSGNMINAAHHSDLTHTSLKYDEEHDTVDAKDTKEKIAEILEQWIEDFKLESK